ncbi:hypothetical protein [Chitinilyticum aquatile]|uniref:hypothetical protein n=1 Tax=Chitinilyticum aquatile TaxID=362520 RepID=UPI0004255734|nr:hypothetical protein [Chitinilyticum aquatile]
MTPDQQLLHKLDLLIDHLSQPRAVIPPEKQLWSGAACAEYLGVSTAHFQQRIAPLSHFPAAIELPTATGKNNQRRWKMVEVIRWAESLKQEKKAA